MPGSQPAPTTAAQRCRSASRWIASRCSRNAAPWTSAASTIGTPREDLPRHVHDPIPGHAQQGGVDVAKRACLAADDGSRRAAPAGQRPRQARPGAHHRAEREAVGARQRPRAGGADAPQARDGDAESEGRARPGSMGKSAHPPGIESKKRAARRPAWARLRQSAQRTQRAGPGAASRQNATPLQPRRPGALRSSATTRSAGPASAGRWTVFETAPSTWALEGAPGARAARRAASSGARAAGGGRSARVGGRGGGARGARRRRGRRGPPRGRALRSREPVAGASDPVQRRGARARR